MVIPQLCEGIISVVFIENHFRFCIPVMLIPVVYAVAVRT